MNKEEYLHELEVCLKKHLSRGEVEDILRDYGEYFEDGRRLNKTDMEISAKLGAPELIAGQFAEETGERSKEKHGEELEHLREITVQGLNTVKQNFTGAMGGIHPLQRLKRLFFGLFGLFGRGLRRVGTAFSSVFHQGIPSLWTALRQLFAFLLKVVLRAGVLCWSAVLFGLLFLGLLLLSGLTLVFLLSSLCMMFVSIVTMGLLSAFLTAAGFFYTVFGLTASALCVMAAMGLLRRGLGGVRNFYRKHTENEIREDCVYA